jgi:GGDEF domain-containing protein
MYNELWKARHPMTQKTFYEAIPPMSRISELTRHDCYYDVPADWQIIIVDVKNSTKAIQAGRYKEVNGLAAAAITAMLNLIPESDIPFVFGGDGAAILLPAELVERAKKALRATRALARESFNLELWTGIIPVERVLNDGYRLRVARLKMSDEFQQAIFTGGGLAYAERLLKDTAHNAAYAVGDDGEAEANFTGFQCRWNEIPSPSEETLSLIVRALGTEQGDNNHLYEDVLHQIESLYGDRPVRAPIRPDILTVAHNPRKYQLEVKIQRRNLMYLVATMLLTSIGGLMAHFRVGPMGRYKDIVAASIDNEKFDDSLRMIIAGTAQQREKLRAFLEAKRRAGILVYGMHCSRHALMTCIVYNPFGRQVHFVDGGEGGYTLAAVELKAQLKALKQM